jgi:hypothetical protein
MDAFFDCSLPKITRFHHVRGFPTLFHLKQDLAPHG